MAIDTLTEVIAQAQVLLGEDSPNIFTTSLCTGAARQALKTLNQYYPAHAAELITGVNDQYEYELSDVDSRALSILDVLKQGDNADELDISLTFDEYSEDERIFFRLRSPVTSNDTLIVRYTIPLILSGLDSEIETTIPQSMIPAFIIGTTAEAMRVRARATIETNNLDKSTSDNYREAANELQAQFLADIQTAARQKKAPVGEPDSRAWNDQYFHWNQ